MFFISTERYSDFSSMIERYEQEMRKLFAEKKRNSAFEEPVFEVIAPEEKAVPVKEIQKPELENKTPEPQKIVPDGIGNIIVEVTTGRGAVPLPEIDVVIDRLDPEDPSGRRELIAVLETDRSGRTKPVAVKTVSRELSLVPGNAEPFSTFYVTASEKGFEPAKNRPVDVFANEVSILKIDLIPKPEKLFGGGANG
ncbi:MAG: hypothetical protein E7479_07345 [Ruminococcaceae bacterium]|nr:hypothetical protein [Oscillospiraceae bacterium]